MKDWKRATSTTCELGKANRGHGGDKLDTQHKVGRLAELGGRGMAGRGSVELKQPRGAVGRTGDELGVVAVWHKGHAKDVACVIRIDIGCQLLPVHIPDAYVTVVRPCGEGVGAERL